MSNVIHECPADGSEHLNSPSCPCAPVFSAGAHGDVVWKHRSTRQQMVDETVQIMEHGNEALRELNDALRGA